MRLPYAKYTNSPYQIRTIDFRGYCRKPIIADGQMRDMMNLSSDGYPNLTQRKMRREVSGKYSNPSSLASRKDKLVVVDGTSVYYDGSIVGTVTAGAKQIASINSKICIFPDKKYYDTVEQEFGSLEASCSIETTSTVYIKVSNNALIISGATFSGFKAGDAVTISGFEKHPSNNLSAILVSATDTMLEFPVDTFTVLDMDYTYSSTDKTYKESGNISITRSVPDVDFVMENNNRLWGCSGSTIYASKLGDPTNWNYFNGLSMDSYAVDVGTDGDFTGCAAAGSHLVFFKENYLTKLYGSKPSNYQTLDTKADGVQKGCENSLCLLNGILYYKSRNGVMAYDSGVPECISDDLGGDAFRAASAGTDGVKYYISMQKVQDESWHLFVYDPRNGMWHREDETHAQQFAFCAGELCYIDAGTGKIMSTTGGTGEMIKWYAQLGEFIEYSEDKKIYSKIKIRMKLDAGARVTVSVATDGGEYLPVSTVYAQNDRVAYVPIIPIRCDRFSIRLDGVGGCKVESVVREYTSGSEV